MSGSELDGRRIRLDSASQRDRQNGNGGGNRGNFGGNQGNFGGNRGNFGGNRNSGPSGGVGLTQDDRNAKKGNMGTFAGQRKLL